MAGRHHIRFFPLNGVFVYVLLWECVALLIIPLLQQRAGSEWELPSGIFGLRGYSKSRDT